jgi:hypothetical protein
MKPYGEKNTEVRGTGRRERTANGKYNLTKEEAAAIRRKPKKRARRQAKKEIREGMHDE